MKTKFIPIDYNYFDFNGKNFIKIIGRDEKGKRVCVIDNCDVYLWAILKKNISLNQVSKLINKISKIKLDVKGRNTRVEKVEPLQKNFMNKQVNALKIYVTNYKDLHDIADKLDFKEIEKRRGYDLGYITHYIIEKKIYPLQAYEISGDLIAGEDFAGIAQFLDVDYCLKLNNAKKSQNKFYHPKILAYDIETDSVKLGEGEILMISLVSENYKKVITWKNSSTEKQDYIEYVKDEAELLERFVECVREISPDFLIGYFSDGFDLPYLKARAEKKKVKLSLGIDGSVPKFSRGNELRGKINGIVHIDILKFIRTSYSQYMKSETLSLDEVAKEFLGDSKKEFVFKHSSEIKNNEWVKYYEYNLHDSVLTYNLFKKFWPDLLEFTKIIKEPVYDISRNGLSKQVENYILHNLERFNEIPEKRPTYKEISERKGKRVQGAFVFEPTPGLYENIAIFDFTSMHTSIIISMNLSKETLLHKKEKECYETPELEINGKKQILYFSKKPGFFPTLMQEIFKKRKEYKERYKKNPNDFTKAQSNAFKLLSASAHGYIGFFGARYYSYETSAAILGFVRKFNKEIIEKTDKAGFKVVFGDTDSVGFLMQDKNKKQVKDFLKKLNKELPGVMELELEGFFKRGLWVSTRSGNIGAKKKYALLDEKGGIKIRGFETVRRDWCNLSRKMQDKVLRLILENGDEKKALGYVKEIIKKIKNREIEKSDLLIRTQLKKPISEYKSISPHVVAAMRMKKLEIPVSQGNLIEYFIADSDKKKKLVRERVKLPNEEGEYDIEYYLKKQILPSVENIFQVFNININEIIDGKKQGKLGEWF